MHTIESSAPIREHDIILPIADTSRLTEAAHDARLSALERIHLRLALWLLLTGLRRASSTLDRETHQARHAQARDLENRRHRELQHTLLRPER